MTSKRFKIDYYKNMSHDDFEKFCERLMTLHKTGVYIPPPPKPRICNNKKRAKKTRREYIPEEKELNTTFGKGRVGVSCESYGVRNCACCPPDNVQRPRILRKAVLQNKILPQNMELKTTYENGKVEFGCELYGIKNCSCCHPDNAQRPSLLTNLLQNKTLRTSEIYEDQVQQILNSYRTPKIVGNTSVAPILVIDDDDEHKTPVKLGTTICLNSSNELDISNTSLIDHQTDIKPSVKVENNKKVLDEIIIFDSDSDEDKKKYVLSKSKPDKLKAESKMLLKKLMNNVNEKENDKPPVKLKVKSAKNTRFTNNTSLQATAARSLNCPVCFEPLANKEVMSTICGHLFCTNCIKNCIRATKSCPNCRKKLTLKSIHPIFF